MINSQRRLMAAMSLVKNGGEAERRDVLLSLLLRRAASYKVSTGNVFIHKAVPFFCVLKNGDSNSKKITLTHSASRQ